MARRLTYRDLHWGTNPSGQQTMQLLAQCTAEPVGEIKAVSYATVKDGKPGVWRHAFDKHDGRRPYLLEENPTGKFELGDVPSDLLAIGKAVDIELDDGPRLVVGQCWFATDEGGSAVWLCSPSGVPFQIEARAGAHHVTARGIEQ